MEFVGKLFGQDLRQLYVPDFPRTDEFVVSEGFDRPGYDPSSMSETIILIFVAPTKPIVSAF
ncbi:MAG TPA: hypothetical protein PK765_00010 [bacterium]|nr:hypothetical protein [bacterium]